MPKSTGPTDGISLLSLASLDSLPEVAAAIAAKEVHASALNQCEEGMHTRRRQVALYSQKGQPDPAMAASMATEATAKLHELERQHAQTIAELRTANAAIAEAREHEREKLMPALRALALPVIDRRLEDLAVLAMVARLLGAKAPARAMRESHAQEKRYLEELRAVLTTEGRE